MKRMRVLTLLLIVMLVIAGCGGGTSNSPEAGSPETEKPAKRDGEEASKSNVKQKEEAVEAPSVAEGQEKVDAEVVEEVSAEGDGNPIDPNVWIKGEVTIENKKVMIKGSSNLPADTTLRGEITAKGYNMFGYTDDTKTENNGSFSMEIKQPQLKEKDPMDLKIVFKPQDAVDPLKEIFGQKGEKLTGPYVHQYVDSDEIYYQVVAAAVITLDDKQLQLEEPKWNKPEDQGSPEVWIKPTVSLDKNNYYVTASSNLLEGTQVNLSIDIPDRWHVGYNDETKAGPDGSIKLQVQKPKNIDNFYILIRVKPDDNMWPTAKEAYGEKGQKFKGKHVKTENTDEGSIKYIQVKLKVNSKK